MIIVNSLAQYNTPDNGITVVKTLPEYEINIFN
jgi:hypothetical protein